MAVRAVREAARLCRAVQAGMDPGALEKKDRSPVTVADFGSQALVCRAIREVFPDDPIIGEEDATALRREENAAQREQVVEHVRALGHDASGEEILRWIDLGGAQDYSDRFWTLDPIDGTKGFLRGDQYAIALALVVDGTIEVGVLGCPNLSQQDGRTGDDARGVLFIAVRGQGTQAVPLGGEGGTSVRASDTTDSSRARFCESFESGHSSHADAAAVADHLGITADPVRIDSQAKYGLLARGDADIYLRLPTGGGWVENIWDHAAGLLVVTEAGGRVTDITGAALDFTHGTKLTENRGVVATNGKLHARVIEALRAVGVS